MIQVMPSLRELGQLYQRHRFDCPLVLMTRVREPLDYYLSFFRWGVAFRQREDPNSFGRNFIDWVERVPNLQSTMMMQSMAAMAAEYHVNTYKRVYSKACCSLLRAPPAPRAPAQPMLIPLLAWPCDGRLRVYRTRSWARQRRKRGRSSPPFSMSLQSWAR
jgi:hypothetical protein